MAMVPKRYPEFIAILRRLVHEGRVSAARVDDAVRRILRVKAASGVWAQPKTDRQLTSLIGAPEHRAVARQAVRESVVLLKNEGHVLPLARRGRILVAGPKADDVGAQCGGWTVGWMGRLGPVTPGASILQAVRRAAGGANVTYSPDASGAAQADVVVVAVGEEPYAEWRGDRADLSLSEADRALVEGARRAGKPVVVVLLTGRPLVLGQALSASDGFLLAWLPGTEVDGIADVLFGDSKPTGKLPHSWPQDMARVPVNRGDQPYAPLIPYGFGLTY